MKIIPLFAFLHCHPSEELISLFLIFFSPTSDVVDNEVLIMQNEI